MKLKPSACVFQLRSQSSILTQTTQNKRLYGLPMAGVISDGEFLGCVWSRVEEMGAHGVSFVWGGEWSMANGQDRGWG